MYIYMMLLFLMLVLYKNNKGVALTQIAKLIQRNYGTNIIILDIPQRYDISLSSCVNYEIEEFNRKLKKTCHLTQPCLTVRNKSQARIFHKALFTLELFRKGFSSTTYSLAN
jgi:hypothetical protein